MLQKPVPPDPDLMWIWFLALGVGCCYVVYGIYESANDRFTSWRHKRASRT